MLKEIMFDDEYFKELFPVNPDIVSNVKQEFKNDISAQGANIFSNMLSPEIDLSRRHMEFFSPGIFRKPVSFKSPYRLNTQLCAPQRLINLSFSQPSTPKTPAFTGLNQPTSFRSTIEAMVLTTPMLIKTLDNLQQQTSGSQSPYPDILQLIDDDTCLGAALDQHMERNETNLTDNNIEDYVLDLSQDVKRHTLCSQNTMTTSVTGLQPQVFQRTRRRTKLMTEEERQSLQRIKYEKQKQKRKEKFSKTPRRGTRKSKRVRRQVVRYS